MEQSKDQTQDLGHFAGSAVIISASYGPCTTHVQLRTFTGESFDYSIGGVPDQAGADELRTANLRALSVKIPQNSDICSVIALGPDGPRRLDVSLGTALALHQSGVYSVVDGGLRVHVPCSTQRKQATAQP